MNQQRRTSILIAFLLGVAGLLQPAAAQNPHDVGVGSHSLDDSSRRDLRALGVERVRITIYWNIWESSEAYRSTTSAEIEQAAREGLNLLAVVHGQPPRYSFQSREAALEAYVEFVTSMVARFPQVEAWQLWNEMDVPTFTDLFGAGGQLDPEAQGRLYGRMLDRTYTAIKRANPTALVVTGGLAGPVDTGFPIGLLQSGARMDAFAIHAYGFPVSLSVEQRGAAARAVLDRFGRSSIELWVTEFGMEEAVVPPGFDRSASAIDRYHLEAWRDPVEWNRRIGLFDRMYGHVLRQDGDRSYDLIRRNGTLRPAAEWLREYLHQLRP